MFIVTCLSCGVEPHTTVHVFCCSSHSTPLTELDLWKRPRLKSEFLLACLSSIFPLFLTLLLSPLLLAGKKVRGNHHYKVVSIMVPKIDLRLMC